MRCSLVAHMIASDDMTIWQFVQHLSRVNIFFTRTQKRERKGM